MVLTSFDNTDDSEKNHVLVRREHGLCAVFCLAVALSEARAFGLTDAHARLMASGIAEQVAQRQIVFKALKVRGADMDVLAQYPDGTHLREQRREVS